MRKMLLVSVAILCSAVLPGCNVLFDHPLSDPKDKQVDERLLGTWYAGGEERKYYLHIERAGRDEGANFALVEMEFGSGIQIMEGSFFTAKIGEHCFASLQLKKQAEDPEGKSLYFPIYYTFNKEGGLRYAMADGAEFEPFVKAKELKGEIADDRLRTITIHESTEALVKFLKAKDPEKIFKAGEDAFVKIQPPKMSEKKEGAE